MQRYPPSMPVKPGPDIRQRAKVLADSRHDARHNTSTTATAAHASTASLESTRVVTLHAGHARKQFSVITTRQNTIAAYITHCHVTLVMRRR